MPAPAPWTRTAVVDAEVATLPQVSASWIDSGDGSSTYVLEAGPLDSTRPPLVLVHGLGEHGVADFYPVLPALTRDRRVIAIDLPGLGRSTLGSAAPTPEVFMRRVMQVAAARASDGFDLLGHSLGGVVVLLVAAELPNQVRRLVLVDVAGVLHREAFVGSRLSQALDPVHRVSPRAGQLLEGAGKAVVSMLRVLEPSDQVMTLGARAWTGTQMQAALALIQANVGPALDLVQTPTLLLWGEDDPVAPLRTAHLLRGRLANARLVTFASVGHVPMTDATTKMIDEVRGFIDDTATAVTTTSATTPTAPITDRACNRMTDLVIEGHYQTLTLRNCHRVTLRGVHATRIVSEGSDGIMQAVHVSEGVQLRGSDWVVTAGRFDGDVALQLADSRIDIAGTRLHGTHAAIQATVPARVLMSVVDLQSPQVHASGHGEARLRAGQGY